MAVQTGAPGEQFLQLKAGQLSNLAPGDRLPLASKGKNSTDKVVMNGILHHSFRKYMDEVKPTPVIGINYHQEIVNAVKNCDPEAVSHWIEADLTDSTRFVLSIFDTTQ